MTRETYIEIEEILAAHPYVREILQRLTGAGYDAVLIGGVVRDALLAQWEGRRFIPEDVDIATSARPEEVKRIFRDWKALEVGETFGVLWLVAPDGQEYEVATYRAESGYDGRWPGEVGLIRDLEGDLSRRDFTINGLAIRDDGRVIDLVGGIPDLKTRIIRTIGDPEERFGEDYLRMLRAVRCACLIDGRLTPEVSRAIRQNGVKLLSISWERIRNELFRILETPRASKGIKMLDEHGILDIILPEIGAAKGVKQPEKYHPEGDVYTHTLLALEVADRLGFGPLVKFSVLVHDIGKPEAFAQNRGENMAGHEVIGERLTEELGRRLRLSRQEINTVRYLVRQHLRIAKLPQMTRARQMRFIKEGAVAQAGFTDLSRKFPLFGKLLQLLLADCEASVHRSSGWLPVFEKFVELLPLLKRLEELEAARKLIDGHDILQLGVGEGPEVGRILDQVYDQILSGRIGSREEALEIARRLALQFNR